MPRVYHVTFTKEFEASVLAESGEALRYALDLDDIDGNWSPPDEWDITIRDAMPDNKTPPLKLPKVDAVVVGSTIYNAADQEAAEVILQAEDELTSRWQATKQLALPFEKP